MKHGSGFRNMWLVVLALAFAAGAVAQPRVVSYSPPEVTVGALPGQNLPVTVTMQEFQLGPQFGSSGIRAYWIAQGGTQVGITGESGSNIATVSLPPAVRAVAGSFPVVVCNFVNVGQGSIEACTEPAASASFIINSPPVFTAGPALPQGVQGSDYFTELSVSGGTVGAPGNPYNWALQQGSSLPGGLLLNEKDGSLTGTPTVNGNFSFTVVATDLAGVSTAPRTFTLVIQPPVSISTVSPLPPATVGVFYTTTVVATGGFSPYQWQLVASILPQGLNLNQNTGVISGTPTLEGLYSFTMGVLDQGENSASRSFNLSIAPPITFDTSSPLPNAVSDEFYAQIISVSGGNSPFTWELAQGSSLPPGLTLEAFNGSNARELSGVPTQAGLFTFTVRVTDEDGRQAERLYQLTVVPGLAITTTSPLPPGTVQVPYSVNLVATGGVAPYQWQLVESNLPAGLNLDVDTGVISGTPQQAGEYEFFIEVMDSNENFRSRTFQLSIAEPLVITTTSPLPPGVAERSYYETVSAAGGRSPFTWALAPGSVLPPGLGLEELSGSETIAITGTPTQPGAFVFTLRVTDIDSRQEEREFALTIEPALAITTAAPLPPATRDSPYSLTFEGTGGVPPYSWSIDPLPPPPGLAFDESTGVLSGTPTTAGSFDFMITLGDSQEASISRSFTLVVSDPLVISTASPLPPGVAERSYYETVSATGGRSPFTWALAPGSVLPPGLGLEELSGSETIAITGTPTQPGAFAFTLRVTDIDSRQEEREFALTIEPALAITTTAPLPPATRDSPYSLTFEGTGGVPQYYWSLDPLPPPPGLTFDESTGVLSGTPTTAGSFDFMITLGDSQEASISRSFTLIVSDPLVISTTSPLPDAAADGFYGELLIAAGGAPPYTWALAEGSVLPAGLSLNPGPGEGSGEISGTPTNPGDYSFTAIVTDSDGREANRLFALTVRDALAIVSDATLPPGTPGVAYEFALQAAGGFSPYSWRTVDGVPVAPGLVLNETGVISGTPTESGVFSVAIEVMDSQETVQSRVFSITVREPVTITTNAILPAATAGSPYTTTFAATGGRPAYLWSVGEESSLPPGLVLSASTGVLSGTPTQAGSFEFEILATDQDEAQGARTFTLAVFDELSITTTNPLTRGAVGSPYSLTLGPAGGTSPYSWFVAEGSQLPPGLSLARIGGLISGTPTEAGVFSFTVRLEDTAGGAATATLTLTVSNPLLFTTNSPLPEASRTVPYGATLEATGGSPPYLYSVAPGSTLPPGLTLAGLPGLLSGTPTEAGDFRFTLQVLDTQAVMASREFELSVLDGLAITTTSPLPSGSEGIAYTTTLSAIGGATPYTWSLVGAGALPPGLLLAADTGVISGVPTEPGSFAFTIQVTDAQGAQVIRSVVLAVGQPLTILTDAQLPGVQQGVAYSQLIQATGGTPPYTFEAAPGTLPPGLALDAATGVISGIATAIGTYSIPVTVRDSEQNQVSRTFILEVTEDEPELTILTEALPDGLRGNAYSVAVLVRGGMTPLTFSLAAGALPPGLTGPSASGVISGTPTQSGEFTFTIRVQDNQESSADREFTVRILGTLRFLTGSPLPGASIGEPVQIVLEADGGTEPYTFSLGETPLPAGIILNSNGALSGTPSAPFNGSITFRVTDASTPPEMVERSFQWRIGDPLTIITMTLPNAVVGQSYSQAIQVEGGSPAYSYAVSEGNVPPGLALNATGTLAGAPTMAGVFAFTIRVTDQEERSADQAYSITAAPLGVSTLTIRPAEPNPPPNSQQSVEVLLSQAVPLELDGTLTMQFTPSGIPPVDDPAIQFVSGGRTVDFRIPAGQTNGLFGTETSSPPVQTGTVAGEIRITAALRQGAFDVTPNPVPTVVIVVPEVAPVISDLSVTRTPTGLTVVVRGFSTTRSMMSATLNFISRAGSNTSGPLSFTVDLAAAFGTWFTSAASAQHGSRFQLTIPVTVTGDPADITGLSLQLRNGQGVSNTLNANF